MASLATESDWDHADISASTSIFDPSDREENIQDVDVSELNFTMESNQAETAFCQTVPSEETMLQNMVEEPLEDSIHRRKRHSLKSKKTPGEKESTKKIRRSRRINRSLQPESEESFADIEAAQNSNLQNYFIKDSNDELSVTQMSSSNDATLMNVSKRMSLRNDCNKSFQHNTTKEIMDNNVSQRTESTLTDSSQLNISNSVDHADSTVGNNVSTGAEGDVSTNITIEENATGLKLAPVQEEAEGKKNKRSQRKTKSKGTQANVKTRAKSTATKVVKAKAIDKGAEQVINKKLNINKTEELENQLLSNESSSTIENIVRNTAVPESLEPIVSPIPGPSGLKKQKYQKPKLPEEFFNNMSSAGKQKQSKSFTINIDPDSTTKEGSDIVINLPLTSSEVSNISVRVKGKGKNIGNSKEVVDLTADSPKIKKEKEEPYDEISQLKKRIEEEKKQYQPPSNPGNSKTKKGNIKTKDDKTVPKGRKKEQAPKASQRGGGRRRRSRSESEESSCSCSACASSESCSCSSCACLSENSCCCQDSCSCSSCVGTSSSYSEEDSFERHRPRRRRH